ncbi:MAG: hypothetical protein J2O48_03450, partial [Solirubrobacterales bacterium]|nr:hypothetical protein [Solirubrobacterales bacterium]
RGWQPPRLVWGLLASALVLWIAAALSNTPGFYRPAQDPRYLETNATIFLAVVALATPRPKLARGGTVASLIVLAVVAATNAKGFGSARTIMNTSDVDSRAEEGAMLIMRNVAASSFSPGFPGDPGGLINITEQEFLNADAKFGSQADTVAQVESAPPTTRDLVDKDLSVGELKLAPGTQTYAERVHSCRTVGSSVLMLRTGPTRLRLTAKQLPMAVYASRFGSPQAFQLGQVQPHATRVLAAPSDGASSVPWRFTLTGTGGRVCTSAPDLGSS